MVCIIPGRGRAGSESDDDEEEEGEVVLTRRLILRRSESLKVLFGASRSDRE